MEGTEIFTLPLMSVEMLRRVKAVNVHSSSCWAHAPWCLDLEKWCPHQDAPSRWKVFEPLLCQEIATQLSKAMDLGP